MSTHDVRVWAVSEARSAFRVRWAVAGTQFNENFDTAALADGFCSELVAAQREGIAFDESTGLPEEWPA